MNKMTLVTNVGIVHALPGFDRDRDNDFSYMLANTSQLQNIRNQMEKTENILCRCIKTLQKFL